jgi:phosphoglycerate dehydrogenase-like enzyme
LRPTPTPIQRRRAVLDWRDERPVFALPDWAAARIAAAFPKDWDFIDVRAAVSGSGDGTGGSAEAREAVAGAEVYLGFGFSPDLFAAATRPHDILRWVHSGSAGVSSALTAEFVASDVTLTNSAGIHAPPIAETIIGMMLHFARGLDYSVRAQQRGEWFKTPFEQEPDVVREIAGGTVGIYGFGGIGRELAWRATALGMTVLATRRSDRTAPPGVELLRGDDALDELLERSDYVVIAAPSTAETRGSINAAALRRMKKSAVLINVARGDIIDDDALIDALRNHRLRGAALDAFNPEPLPPQSEYWSLPNVLITPHVSATTSQYWRRETDLIVENIERYLGGRPLRNVVDKNAGY